MRRQPEDSQRLLDDQELRVLDIPFEEGKILEEAQFVLSLRNFKRSRGSWQRFMLTILIVVLIFDVAVVISYLVTPSLTVKDIPVLNWLILVNTTMLSFIFLWGIGRIIVWSMEKVGTRYFSLYEWTDTLISFEGNVRWVVWAIFLISIYPSNLSSRLKYNMDVHDAIWRVIVCILLIALFYALKKGMIHIIENNFMANMKKLIKSSLYQEHVLMKLESISQTKLNQFLLKPERKNRIAFKSPTLRDIKSKIASSAHLDELAHASAKEIFASYGLENGSFITVKDLVDKGLHPSDVREIFQVFDFNNDGFLTVDELSKSIQMIFKQRRELKNERKSRAVLVDVSNTLLNIILVFVSFLLILFEFNVNISGFLIAAGTAILGLSFAYAKPLQELFDSIFMLFFVHPFNVGDFLKIDDGPTLIVEKVGLFSTYFISVDGYGVYYRNSKLANSKLTNLNQGSVNLDITFSVRDNITTKDLAAISEQLKEDFEKSKILMSKFRLYIDKIDRLNSSVYLILSTKLKKEWKWQDLAKLQTLKTSLLLRVQEICSSMNIVAEATPARLIIDKASYGEIHFKKDK